MTNKNTPVSLSTSIQQTNPFNLGCNELDSASNDELTTQATLRDVGVCFSGGGSRALSAAMGQLRGLSNVKDSSGNLWIDRVGTISCVSGGCWASSLYTFLPDTISYDDFLNAPAEPNQLNWDSGNPAANLSYLPPNNMGWVPTRLGWDALYQEVKDFMKVGFKDTHQWWRAAIGNLVFKPFGLYQPDSELNPTKYYGWQESYFNQQTKPYNQLTLKVTDFNFARNRWPWLTMNASMFYPDFSNKEELVPFFSTLQNGGVLSTFPQQNQSGPLIGGGVMQPFALGSQYASAGSNGRVNVTQARPFSLVDMAAMSSTAFAAEFEKRYGLKDLVPEYSFWPVSGGGSTGQTYQFADGGNLENSGLASLLATTQLTKIVVFINSSEAVQHDLDTWNYTQVPATIPPLFGYQPIDGMFDVNGYRPYAGASSPSSPLMQYNQVFPSSRFQELLDGLKSAADDFKGTAMFYQSQLPVQINDWFGISKTRNVDVLWVCNNKVKDWENQIVDSKIKHELDLRDIPDTALSNFPYYGTLTQLHLSEQQVNMLAHLSCWNVMSTQNRSSWNSIFG